MSKSFISHFFFMHLFGFFMIEGFFILFTLN